MYYLLLIRKLIGGKYENGGKIFCPKSPVEVKPNFELSAARINLDCN
jgi:hypothetical protein